MAPAAHRRHGLTEFTARSGGGMRFEPTIERELDDDLRSLAGGLPGGEDGLLAVVEFPGPRGVPDLIAVSRGFDALHRRLASGTPFVESSADCAVIAALDVNRTRSSANVVLRTGMSTEQVARRLRALSHSGIVVPHGTGYRRSAEVEPIGRMYAFEAKVSDWRRGLAQALRYSTWADASSLVLLRPPGNLDALTRRCAEVDIGLAVRSEWIRRPKLGRPRPALRLEASERLALEVSKLG